MNSYPVQQLAPEPKKSKKTWIIIVIVLLLLCCLCTILTIGGYYGYDYLQKNITSLGEQFGINPSAAESNPQATSQSGNAPQQPLIQLPNPFGVKLGDEVRCGQCGFSYKKIPGYDYNDWVNFQLMTAPGASETTGPIISLTGGPPSKEILTTDDLIKQLVPVEDGVTQSPPKNIKVGGVDAISIDIENTQDGIVIKSRIVGALIGPKQMFVIMGVATADKWDETNSYIEAVMNSVTFFAPEPTPVPTNQP
jgi:hypothetical protein